MSTLNTDELMPMLTIHNIEESLKEEQARIILRKVLTPNKREKGLGRKIHQHFADIGSVELKLPKRLLPRPAPDFSDL